MPEGYPDWTRVARSGQYQLYNGTNVTPTYDTPFFQGYVGNFPFINVFTNMAVSGDFMEMVFAWFPDSTFTNTIGFRFAVRSGADFATVQYANLSDWLAVYYVTKSGNPMEFANISIYGTQQPSTPRQLMSQDVPLFSQNVSIPGSTTETYQVTRIAPGDAQFEFSTGATDWEFNILPYNYAAGAYQVLTNFTHAGFAGGNASVSIPMLDVPYEVQLHNEDAGAQLFFCQWVSK